MDVAILMDPLAGTYPGETTHYLGRELARRGHAIAYCTTADVAYEAPAVTATVRALQYTPAIPEVSGPPERGKHLGITRAPRYPGYSEVEEIAHQTNHSSHPEKALERCAGRMLNCLHDVVGIAVAVKAGAGG